VETENHVRKLDKAFKFFGKKPKVKKCTATVGILKESEEVAADFKSTAAINAALISAAQKIEQYEIASYGCLHEWALLLGKKEASNLLKEILVEEKAACEALTALARSRSNHEALGEVKRT
jgi:ferritin-like metal-binding protein YciE